MKDKFSITFLLMAVLFTVCLITSNLFATKVISLWGINLPGAVIIFPLSYILNDCISEVWGYRKARLVIWTAFAMNLLVVVLGQLLVWLPAASFWDGAPHFDYMFNMAPRVAGASLLAFLAGSHLNSMVLSKMKIAVSRLFQRVSNRITDIHTMPRLGIFRVMKKSVVEELRRFPEKTATAVSLLYYIGNKYVAVPLKRDARFAGKSGYNLSKMLSLTFARIFSFSMFPIRMVTYLGALLCVGSMIAALGLIIYKLAGNVLAGWTSMMVMMLFLFGLNFAFLGILGEYIGRIFLETKQRPNYIIEQVI